MDPHELMSGQCNDGSDAGLDVETRVMKELRELHKQLDVIEAKLDKALKPKQQRALTLGSLTVGPCGCIADFSVTSDVDMVNCRITSRCSEVMLYWVHVAGKFLIAGDRTPVEAVTNGVVFSVRKGDVIGAKVANSAPYAQTVDLVIHGELL